MGTRYLVVIKHEGLQFRFSTFSQLVLERRTVRKWCQVTNYSVFVFCLHKRLMLRLSFLAPVNSTLLLYIYQLFQAYVYQYTLLHLLHCKGPINQTDRQSVNIFSFQSQLSFCCNNKKGKVDAFFGKGQTFLDCCLHYDRLCCFKKLYYSKFSQGDVSRKF